MIPATYARILLSMCCLLTLVTTTSAECAWVWWLMRTVYVGPDGQPSGKPEITWHAQHSKASRLPNPECKHWRAIIERVRKDPKSWSSRTDHGHRPRPRRPLQPLRRLRSTSGLPPARWAGPSTACGMSSDLARGAGSPPLIPGTAHARPSAAPPSCRAGMISSSSWAAPFATGSAGSGEHRPHR